MSAKNTYFWSAVDRFGSQAILFLGNILIARILSPDDYGLIAMLSIILGIAMNFTDSGFSDCLIRKQDVDKQDYGTVTSFNIMVALMMYLVIFYLAPFISHFFQRQELLNVSRVIGLSIILKAITLTEFTRLRKELKFQNLALISILSNIVMVVVSIYMALNGFKYWSLAFQPITLGIVKIICLILMTRWVPYLTFSFSKFIGMSGFSINLLISYLINQIGQNLYSVVIGKFQPTSSLGFYKQAEKMKDIPIVGISSVIFSTSYSLIASEKDIKLQKRMYVSLLTKYYFLHLGLITFLYGASSSLIDILFGMKWAESSFLLQLMLIGSIFVPFMVVNANIAKISGKSILYRNLGILRVFLSISALMITMRKPVELIIYGQIIAAYVSAFFDAWLCGNLIEFKVSSQFKIFITELKIPLIALVISILTSSIFHDSLKCFTSFTVSYIIIYIGLSELLNQDVYIKIKKSVVTKLLKR